MTAATPGQAAYDTRTCPECQAMIKAGGHRFMDLMGHAGYVAFSVRAPVPPWPEVREAFAQAVLAAAGGWGGCDTFDAWAAEQGFPAEDCGDSYGHGDLLAACEAGALAAMQENADTAQQPQPAPEGYRQAVHDIAGVLLDTSRSYAERYDAAVAILEPLDLSAPQPAPELDGGASHGH